MTHRHPTNLLEAYIDGELTPVEAAQIQENIAACAECRIEYDELRRLKEVLGQSKSPIPNDDYWQEVDSLVRAKTIDRITVEPAGKATPEDKRIFVRSLVSFAFALFLFITAISLNTDDRQSIARTTQNNSPVFAVAPLQDVLPSLPEPVFTEDDQQHWAEAILQLSLPGSPGRMAGLRDVPRRPI